MKKASISVALLLLSSLIINKTSVAQSKPWPVPKEYASLTNPNTNTPEFSKDGKALYTSYCVPCHGAKGKGDGIAAASLTPKPADHTSAIMLNETDGNLFYKISEGRLPMPTYKSVLTEKQRWELVAYIRTLCKTTQK